MPFFTPDAPPEGEYAFRRFRIPKSTDVLGLINGALDMLLFEGNYEQRGDMTPEETAWMFREVMLEYWQSEVWMIGMIVPYITAAPPDYCLPCEGDTYNRVDYPQLYAALAPVFQVDADHFITPDLRGRTVIGAGTGTGLTLRQVGDEVGAETHQLTVTEMPQHNHEYSPAVVGDLDVEGVGIPQPNAAQIVPLATYNTYNRGGDGAHNNMQPSTALSYAVIAK
jgi:microcystin-dependent protein